MKTLTLSAASSEHFSIVANTVYLYIQAQATASNQLAKPSKGKLHADGLDYTSGFFLCFLRFFLQFSLTWLVIEPLWSPKSVHFKLIAAEKAQQHLLWTNIHRNCWVICYWSLPWLALSTLAWLLLRWTFWPPHFFYLLLNTKLNMKSWNILWRSRWLQSVG